MAVPDSKLTRRTRSTHSAATDLLEAFGERLPGLLVDPTGRILSVSRRCASHYGVRPAGWIGQRIDEVLPRVPSQGNPGDSDERVLGPQSGSSSKRIEAIPTPLPDGNSFVVLIDRTEQERARAECLHLGQLASAGRLISGIVHEINNPLSGIIGYTQLLLIRELDRETRAALEKIHEEAIRSSRIVRNLLDFARRRPVADTSTPLPTVIRKAIELKAHDLRIHNIAVQLEIPRTLPPAAADPHQLLQVFVNLIANAEQAMYESDKGGRIVLRASATRSTIAIKVEDTGPGIPVDDRERVFEPFYTTKTEGKGTGLGLGLCRDILRRIGGSIVLAKNGESGATFEIRIPIATAGDAADKPKRRPRREFVRGRRILVVEDDPVCRAMVSEAFESTGNEVHAFDRSETALKFLRSRWVDAVISDLHRPGTNGLEFHEHVTRIDEALARRILFLTGDTMNQELAQFLIKAGNPVLSKPVELADLHSAVQKLLDRNSRRQKTLFATDS